MQDSSLQCRLLSTDPGRLIIAPGSAVGSVPSSGGSRSASFVRTRGVARRFRMKCTRARRAAGAAAATESTCLAGPSGSRSRSCHPRVPGPEATAVAVRRPLVALGADQARHLALHQRLRQHPDAAGLMEFRTRPGTPTQPPQRVGCRALPRVLQGRVPMRRGEPSFISAGRPALRASRPSFQGVVLHSTDNFRHFRVT